MIRALLIGHLALMADAVRMLLREGGGQLADPTADPAARSKRGMRARRE